MTDYRGIAPGGAHCYHYQSAATTNATSINTRPAMLTQIIAINTNATVYYLKFFDSSTAPNVGTDTPLFCIPIPGATGAAGVVVPFPAGVRFDNGLAFAMTGLLADSDATNAATGVVLAIFWI